MSEESNVYVPELIGTNTLKRLRRVKRDMARYNISYRKLAKACGLSFQKIHAILQPIDENVVIVMEEGIKKIIQ